MQNLKISKNNPEENYHRITEFIKNYLTDPKRSIIKIKNGKEYPLFRDIIFGVADANDPIFKKYKQVVHLDHWTPVEACEKAAILEGWSSNLSIKSVLVFIGLLSEEIIKSNLENEKIVSEAWINAKYRFTQIVKELGEVLKKKLQEYGYFTCDPIEVKGYGRKKFKQNWNPDEKKTWGSHFSVRHAAFAAGMGTFSLNDAFITDIGGITHRVGVIVTELELPISKRSHSDLNFRENCLWYRSSGEKCGKCIKKCPVNAIEAKINGHNKDICAEYTFGEMAPYSKEHYGVPEYGCGKCQVGLPCTYKTPDDD